MSTAVWILFIILTGVHIFIVIQYARRNESALQGSVLCSFLPFFVLLLAYAVFGLYLPQFVLILVIIAQFTHNFIGYYLRLYELSKTYDRWNHAYSTFSYALFAYFTLTALFGAVSPKILAAILVLTLGISLGVFVEISEFISDTKSKNGLKMQKGLTDTNFDMLYNTGGSIIAAVVAYLFMLP